MSAPFSSPRFFAFSSDGVELALKVLWGGVPIKSSGPKNGDTRIQRAAWVSDSAGGPYCFMGSWRAKALASAAPERISRAPLAGLS